MGMSSAFAVYCYVSDSQVSRRNTLSNAAVNSVGDMLFHCRKKISSYIANIRSPGLLKARLHFASMAAMFTQIPYTLLW